MCRMLAALLLLCLSSLVQAQTELTAEEQAWLHAHAGQPLRLGLESKVGMEYFTLQGQQHGYVPALLQLIRRETGLNITLSERDDWTTVYNHLLDGHIELLLGANYTEQRSHFMAFTRPIVRFPYRVFVRQSSDILNIGDLGHKRVGFLLDDMVASLFPNRYQNIHYDARFYTNYERGMQALSQGELDAMITSTGNETLDYLQRFPHLHTIASLHDITSDMTLSSQLSNEPLIRLLDRVLQQHSAEIATLIEQNRLQYNRLLMHLDDDEQALLDSHRVIKIGMANDYLPFDANDHGKPAGITGAFLNSLHDLTGLPVQAVSGDFDTLFAMMQQGQLDMLNMAKTSERIGQFLFTDSFYQERDIILGRRESPYVQDVYGLEGRRVCVIDGFWHINYLQRNLQHVSLVTTPNLQTSLSRLDKGDADYLIENPTVLSYYTAGLGFDNLEHKGDMAADSFMYFGVNPRLPALVSLFNKALPMMDASALRTSGLNSVPDLRAQRMHMLRNLAALLGTALIFMLGVAAYLLRRYLRQRHANEWLHARQQIMLRDPLVDLPNRLAFNQQLPQLTPCTTPQSWWLIDLNHLKYVNDVHGHLAGDQLLLHLADLLRQQLPDALLFRIGGDEFIAVQEHASLAEAETQYQALVDALCDMTIPLAERVIQLNGPLAAVGMVWRQDAEQSIQETIRLADQQMYQHKRQTRSEPAVHIV